LKTINNEVLKKIYRECKKVLDQTDSNREYLLKVYNSIFKKELGFLHYWMVVELLNVIEKEMAFRFNQE
jgi:hypothetical protein